MARGTGDIEMAFSLVNHLGEADQVPLFLSFLPSFFVNILKVLLIRIHLVCQLVSGLILKFCATTYIIRSKMFNMFF